MLDKVKVKAFDLWFKCIEYQYASGRRKEDKRYAIVKNFVKRDHVFRLSVEERNALVGLGISCVKEVAFGEFEFYFAAFVKDAARRRQKIQYTPKRRKIFHPTKIKQIDPPTKNQQIDPPTTMNLLFYPAFIQCAEIWAETLVD